MAGSSKWVVYTRDDGTTKHAVKLDESNTEIIGLGFDDFDSTSVGVVEPPPKGFQMRYYNVIEPNTGTTRKVYVGSPTNALVNLGISLLLPMFTSAGTGGLVAFIARSLIGEKAPYPVAFDTGLNDGDLT